MLNVRGVTAGYGEITALTDVHLDVDQGEMVTLLGANGAGKTTLLRTISGLLQCSEGTIDFCGQPIHRMAAVKRARLGIGHVPEGRQIFAPLTVRENLEMGAVAAGRRGRALKDSYEFVHDLFPRLAERSRQLGGTLSGGEQQMLAVGRAMMARPSLLMLDEPSLGLAPMVVEGIFDALLRLRHEGVTILLVEQNAEAALNIADRGYVMELGRVVHAGSSQDLLAEDSLRDIYFRTESAAKGQ
ncbi:MAG TPA: ABC transporter ATP-binding protein [Vitreimonas sp.]|nr:ABC transporter ATP-binding protein [Vitreimonas sp.]